MADESRMHDAPATVETTDRGLFDFMKKKEDDTHKDSEAKADAMASGIEKIHVSEPEYKKEEEKKEEKHGGLLEKLHRSDSSSSSSSDEEGDDEEKKKKRKEKKDKKASLKEKLMGQKKEEHHGDTNVPIEKVHGEEHAYSAPSYPAPAAPVQHHQGEEEKKGGLLDKIKDKLPGQHKDAAHAGEHEHKAAVEHEHGHEPEKVVHPAVGEPGVEGPEKEKKGFLDKIKDKIPGFHSKNGAEEKKDHE